MHMEEQLVSCVFGGGIHSIPVYCFDWNDFLTFKTNVDERNVHFRKEPLLYVDRFESKFLSSPFSPLHELILWYVPAFSVDVIENA